MSGWVRPLSTDVWVPDRRVSGMGHVLADREHKSEKPKNPLGFHASLPPAQPPADPIAVDWTEVIAE